MNSKQQLHIQLQKNNVPTGQKENDKGNYYINSSQMVTQSTHREGFDH